MTSKLQDPTAEQTRIYSLGKAIPLLILFASIFFMAFSTIFIKISELEISANSTHFNRLWIATLIFGCWSGFRQITQSPQSKDDPKDLAIYNRHNIAYLLIIALSHTSARFFWTWCLTQTSAANGNILCNLASIFTVLGGWLIFGKTFDVRFLVGVALAFCGAATLGFQDLTSSTDSFVGDLAALASAVFFAISFLSTEKIRHSFSVITLLTWRCFLGFLMILPITLCVETQILPISSTGWLAVIGLATISEVLGHGLVIYSLKNFSSAFVTLCVLFEPILVALLAWVFFAERLGALNLLAFLLIFVGIYIAKTGKGVEAEAA